MRGLKLLGRTAHYTHYRVASFTDAWIETMTYVVNGDIGSRIFYRCVDWNLDRIEGIEHDLRSHLLQMRGLKLGNTAYVRYGIMSHLLQMRGLKPINLKNLTRKKSRIFYRCVDWNLIGSIAFKRGNQSHLLQMRGLKRQPGNKTMLFVCRIFYRCVDWNWNKGNKSEISQSRIFYRCVDWNQRVRKGTL